MLQVKKFHPIVPSDADFNPKTDNEEILICLNCPLPECKDTFECKRFLQERQKLRSAKNGKINQEKN